MDYKLFVYLENYSNKKHFSDMTLQLNTEQQPSQIKSLTSVT